MTVRGVARIVAVTAADFFRGVALCAREMAADIADDLATLVHLNDAIRDAFTNSLDDRLAGYEAHAWPHEDITRRDNIGWATSD